MGAGAVSEQWFLKSTTNQCCCRTASIDQAGESGTTLPTHALPRGGNMLQPSSFQTLVTVKHTGRPCGFPCCLSCERAESPPRFVFHPWASSAVANSAERPGCKPSLRLLSLQRRTAKQGPKWRTPSTSLLQRKVTVWGFSCFQWCLLVLSVHLPDDALV